MPIPYLGSKRKSAKRIYETITGFNAVNQKFDTIVDLFCGGFAISEVFIKNGYKAIANDKNKYVVALIEQAIKGLDQQKVLEWVSREKFFEVLAKPDSYPDWYVGYIMCIWSFGNNQKGYLFGKNIEGYKKAGHELVVNVEDSSIKKLFPQIKQIDINNLQKAETWQIRRIRLKKLVNFYNLPKQLIQLQHLQQLIRLQQLEQLIRLQQLELTNVDYKEVKIPVGAVVYCDIPYFGRAKYHEKDFNHTEFWEWVRKVAKTNKIYVSEYQAPPDFIKVMEFAQNSTLAGGQNKNQPNECLFTT